QSTPEKMLPQTVHNFVREERVLRRGDPLRQNSPSVTTKIRLDRRGVQGARSHLFAGLRVAHLAGASQDDDRLVLPLACLRPDARKESRHLVVLVLSPALVGMVMAF